MLNYYADIHCHMLPRLDDGAESFEESVQMLKIAFREGIRTICLTPHYMPERWKPVFRRSTRNLPSFLFEFPSLTPDFSRIFKIFLLDFFIEKNFFL